MEDQLPRRRRRSARRAGHRRRAGRSVITSGGLGLTEDDLTVDIACALTGQAAIIDEPARAAMLARFGERASAPLMLRQVRVPESARVHANPAGLAPGFEVTVGGTLVVCLPGVPRELHAIYDAGLRERLVALWAARGDAPAIARRTFRAFGLGESQLSARCRGLVDGVPGASLHYQVKFPEVLLKLVVRSPVAGDQAGADAALATLDAGLRERVGEACYGVGEPALPARVAAGLVGAGVTVAVAESCTGGLLGQLLTEPAGASAYFRGGAITYADDEKVRQLGVSPATLAAHGAVSEACAVEMARGAQARFDVDRAIAITGIAGPSGGSVDKPVGTVWLALARRGAEEVTTKHLHWPGARDMVRTLSAWWALALLRDSLPPSG
ncbi:MAG: nicotinamide-nucleotide amidohydrolase family protein [Kofleriaceae bacterium]